MGGSDDPSNLIRLTPEEHYVAHQLLVRMHPEHAGLLWAAVAMTNSTRKTAGRANNRLYGWLRRRFCEMQTGRVVSAEARAKMSAARRGKKFGPRAEETRTKISAASKGRGKSDAHRAALAAAKLGKKFPPRSAEARARMRAAQQLAESNRDRSYTQDPEYRRLQSEKMKGVWSERRARKDG